MAGDKFLTLVDGMRTLRPVIREVYVTDISDPSTELAGLSDDKGRTLLVRQAVVDESDLLALYFWSVRGVVDVPNIVPGDGGYWVLYSAGGEGAGVPPGGLLGEVLAKLSNTDGDTLWTSRQYVCSALASDLDFSGPYTYRTIDAGQSVTFGAPLFEAADGELEIADETDATKVPAEFMALGSGTGMQVVLGGGGYARCDALWASLDLADGSALWLNGGALSQAMPGIGNCVQRLGTLYPSGVVKWWPSPDWFRKFEE